MKKGIILVFCTLMCIFTKVEAKDNFTYLGVTTIFEGNVVNGNPMGNGVMIVMDAKKIKHALFQDVIKGNFNGTTVTDAEVVFSSSWKFTGKVVFSIESNGSAGDVVTYELKKGILQCPNMEKVVSEEDSMKIVRKTDINNRAFHILPFEFETNKEIKIQEVDPFIKSDKCIETRTNYVLEESERKWSISVSPNYKRVYDNGVTYELKGHQIYLALENGRFVNYDRMNNRFNEIIWSYPEGLVNFKGVDAESEILYLNGNSYKGTMEFGPICKDKELAFRYVLGEIDKPSINEVFIAYIDGVEKKSNGAQETWSNRITEYQKNKQAGVYNKVENVLISYAEEDLKKMAKAWDEAKPKLVAEFGLSMVDKLYNYQIEKGMPLELFRRLKQLNLPLCENTHEAYASNDPWKRKTILFTMYNRKTGEIQFQRFLHFNAFDQLYKISNNF